MKYVKKCIANKRILNKTEHDHCFSLAIVLTYTNLVLMYKEESSSMYCELRISLPIAIKFFRFMLMGSIQCMHCGVSNRWSLTHSLMNFVVLQLNSLVISHHTAICIHTHTTYIHVQNMTLHWVGSAGMLHQIPTPLIPRHSTCSSN